MPRPWLYGFFIAVVFGAFFGYFSAEKGVGQTALKLYSQSLSQIDGDRCSGYPVCSQYAKQAFDAHGGFVATAFMVDRLLREWREISDPKRRIFAEGKLRFYDRLSRNDFWLKKQSN